MVKSTKAFFQTRVETKLKKVDGNTINCHLLTADQVVVVYILVKKMQENPVVEQYAEASKYFLQIQRFFTDG